VVIRAAGITGSEVAARNRDARFPDLGVGVLLVRRRAFAERFVVL